MVQQGPVGTRLRKGHMQHMQQRVRTVAGSVERDGCFHIGLGDPGMGCSGLQCCNRHCNALCAWLELHDRILVQCQMQSPLPAVARRDGAGDSFLFVVMIITNGELS